MSDLTPTPPPSNEPASPSVHDLLDKATEAFHKLRGDAHEGRAEQWDSHVATLHMVADHTSEAVENAKEEGQ